MRPNTNLLFSSGYLEEFLVARLARAAAEVENLPDAQIQANASLEIAEHIASKHAVEPLVLKHEDTDKNSLEGRIDVSGDRMRGLYEHRGPFFIASHRVEFRIPFTGESALWNCRPSSYSLTAPRGQVLDTSSTRCLLVVAEIPHDEAPETLARLMSDNLKQIDYHISNQKSQIDGFNAGLPAQLIPAIESRKKRLKTRLDICKLMDIPLSKRSTAGEITLPMPRKLIRPLVTLATAPASSSYQIAAQEYEHIVRVIRHHCATFEAARERFWRFDEETLRDFVLAHLNGHYEGAAHAEAFRGAGRTDIKIEHESRAAFVAECKIWKGPKALAEALDQLLSYLTWRDCKAALIVFYREVAAFQGILSQLPQLLAGHPNFTRRLEWDHPGEFRIECRGITDPDHKVTVQVACFDLFVPENRRSVRQ